jgi:hypothetical protein
LGCFCSPIGGPPFFGRDAILRPLTPSRWNPKCHGSHLHADFVEGTLALPLIEVVAGR